MAEISKAHLEKQRQEYIDQVLQFQGAIAAIDELLKRFYPPDSLTMDGLKDLIGAQSVGEPEPIE